MYGCNECGSNKGSKFLTTKEEQSPGGIWHKVRLYECLECGEIQEELERL